MVNHPFYKCVWCGRIYESSQYLYYPDYCSPKCEKEAKENKKQEREKQERESRDEYYRTHRKCEQCGQTFYISKGVQCEGHLFCSQDCLNLYFSPKVKCEQCSTVFKKCRGFNSGGHLFCSQICLNNYFIRKCEKCGLNYYLYSQGIDIENHAFCSQKCATVYFTETQSSIDLIIGKWRGGDPYELEFRKMGCGFNGFFGLCTKESPSNTSSNSFKEGQMLFRDVEFTSTSTITGQILVPFQSGDQRWFNFIGKINNVEMSVEIGEAKWGWGYNKILLGITNKDELFVEAARLVVLHQQGSTSLIQRKLKLDYDHACKILEQLEFAGIVGAFEGSKAQEVKFTDLDTLEHYLKRITNA